MLATTRSREIDLDLIKSRRRLHNRLGFAVQLAVLRFPGRPLKDLAGVPSRVLAAIADQVQVPASAFARYGDRDNTVYEHLDEIRRTYQFRWHIREETLLAALACLDNFVLSAPLSRSWGTEPPHLLMACACPWG